VAGRKRIEEFLLVHRRRHGEIRRGAVEIERHDPQIGAGAARQLIDRGAAGGKVRHHLRRDLRRIGRHALRDDAVIARKDLNVDPIEPRRRATLPSRQPGDDAFQPPEAARRLGQLRLARRHGGGGRRIAGRQCPAGGLELGKGRNADHPVNSDRPHGACSMFRAVGRAGFPRSPDCHRPRRRAIQYTRNKPFDCSARSDGPRLLDRPPARAKTKGEIGESAPGRLRR
jgi:hypothetical protein